MFNNKDDLFTIDYTSTVSNGEKMDLPEIMKKINKMPSKKEIKEGIIIKHNNPSSKTLYKDHFYLLNIHHLLYRWSTK